MVLVEEEAIPVHAFVGTVASAFDPAFASFLESRGSDGVGCQESREQQDEAQEVEEGLSELHFGGGVLLRVGEG